MADTFAAINNKLDKALNIASRKSRTLNESKAVSKKNKELETSLNFAHSSIELLKKELATQDSVIKELKRDVKLPTKQAKEEKQRAINLKSPSRRNNLNFFNIPEQKDESFEKFEKILRKFMAEELKLSKEDADDISLSVSIALENQVLPISQGH